MTIMTVFCFVAANYSVEAVVAVVVVEVVTGMVYGVEVAISGVVLFVDRDPSSSKA